MYIIICLINRHNVLFYKHTLLVFLKPVPNSNVEEILHDAKSMFY